MKIQYLAGANEDLDKIFNYIAQDNREAGFQILELIKTAINRLEITPLAGTIPPNKTLARPVS